ncbi:MAG: prolipoprotein diacylglyceryl transferase family protein [Nitrospirota bacterium]
MHPEFIQTKYFTINTLWIFFAAALIVGTYVFVKLTVRNGLKIQFISEHSWGIILWSIVGARVLSLILNYKTYFYEFSFEALIKVLYIWDKGLSPTGALVAFVLFLIYICKKNEQDFWKWIDVLTPSILIGLSIGYIGTFFEGINYGKPTSLPWGVNFESSQIKYTIPIHPTQIYAFLYTLAIAITLILISKKKAGFIGLIGIASFSFINFLEQFLRGDDTLLLFGIRVPQVIMLILSITSGIFLYFHYNKPTKTNKSK